jgi:hypothetical protein
MFEQKENWIHEHIYVASRKVEHFIAPSIKKVYKINYKNIQ